MTMVTFTQSLFLMIGSDPFSLPGYPKNMMSASCESMEEALREQIRFVEVFPGRSVVAIRNEVNSTLMTKTKEGRGRDSLGSAPDDDDDDLSFFRKVPLMLQLAPSSRQGSKQCLFSAAVVIADCNVPRSIIDAVCCGFIASRMQFLGLKLLPGGEATKSAAVKNNLEEWLLSRGLGKDGLLIGVGGGVIGDLVGYTASTFLRGVAVVHVATTLMAMVDSSVGGKTAVNSSSSRGDTCSKKNMFGTIHQPLLVVMDTRVALRTLPVRVLREAFAEIVKYDVLFCSEQGEGEEIGLFSSSAASAAGSHPAAVLRQIGPFPSPAVRFLLELASSCPSFKSEEEEEEEQEIHPDILQGFNDDRYWLRSRHQDWLALVEYCVAAKTFVVRQDEREASGLRELLNLGHTIGHAVEAAAACSSNHLLHGEAVAIGLVAEMDLCHSFLKACDYYSVWRLQHVLVSLGLPVTIPRQLLGVAAASNDDDDLLLKQMMHDKKNRHGAIHCSLMKGIGVPFPTKAGGKGSMAVDVAHIKACIRNTLCYTHATTSTFTSASGLPLETRKVDGLLPVRIPGSKSAVNRAVVCAVVQAITALHRHRDSSSISNNEVQSDSAATFRIENALVADDCLLLVHALQRLLVSTPISIDFDSTTESIIVTTRAEKRSTAQQGQQKTISIFVGNSGTTGRFIAAFVAAASPALLGADRVVIHGTNNFHQRPVADLVNSIAAAVAASASSHQLQSEDDRVVAYLAQEGCFPISLKVGCLEGCTSIKVSSTVSSQFLSALLLVSPLLLRQQCPNSSDHDAPASSVAVHCDMKKAVSKSFVDMTIRVMNAFAWPVKKIADTTDDAAEEGHRHGDASTTTAFVLDQQPTRSTVNDGRYVVEPDFTSASYFLSLRALMQASSRTHQSPAARFSTNCDSFLGDSSSSSSSSSLQPDAHFYDQVVRKVCPCPEGDAAAAADSIFTARLCPLPLIDMSDLTDCFITAAVVLFPFADGVSAISGISNQRVKECNRIAAVVHGLRRIGLECAETQDGLTVTGNPKHFFSSSSSSSSCAERRRVIIDCHEDHRLAMAFATLGFFLAACSSPIEIVIDDRRCVEKTFPTFFSELERIRQLFNTDRRSAAVVSRESPLPTTQVIRDNEKKAMPDALTFTEDDGETDGNKSDLVQVVLIGMRYCGKTTLGRRLAACLGCEFFDVDSILCENASREAARCQQQQQEEDNSSEWTCGRVVEQYGWAGFRERELQALRIALNTPHSSSSSSSSTCANRTSNSSSKPKEEVRRRVSLPLTRRVARVIACGGGFVDYEPSLRFMQQHHHHSLSSSPHLLSSLIIFLDRHVEDLVLASGSADRPVYPNNESFRQVHARRCPAFRQLAHVTLPPTPAQTSEETSFSHLCDALVTALQTKVNAKYLYQVAQRLTKHAKDEYEGEVLACIPFTHFLTLMEPVGTILEQQHEGYSSSLIDEIAFAADMIEVRLDSMISTAAPTTTMTPLQSIVSFVENLTAVVKGRLPLLVTFRTVDEGGVFSAAAAEVSRQLLLTGDEQEQQQIVCGARLRRRGGTTGLETYLSAVSRIAGVAMIDIQLNWLTGEPDKDEDDDDDDRHLLRAAALVHDSVAPGVGLIISWHAPSINDSATSVALAARHIFRMRHVVKILRSQVESRRRKSSSSSSAFNSRLIVPKVVLAAGFCSRQSFELHRLMTDAFPDKLFIAVCTGAGGKLSRAINTFLTPVTHEKLQRPGAVGQLTIRQLTKLRSDLGLLPAQQNQSKGASATTYFVAGSPVSASRSPAIHNYIFQHLLGFGPEQQTYTRVETSNPSDVTDALRSSSSLRGASITIPLKESLVDKCGAVSADTLIIGALNTLVVVGRSLLGYNTDWIGLFERLSSPSHVVRREVDDHAPSVIVGAGGTARAVIFALALLRPLAPIYIVNRTVARAVAVADEFNSKWATWRSGMLRCPEIRVGWPISTGPTLEVFAIVGTTPPGAGDLPSYATHLPRLLPSAVVDFAYTSAAPSSFSQLCREMMKASTNDIEAERDGNQAPDVAVHHVTGLDVLVSQAMQQERLWWSLGVSEWPATIPYFPLRGDVEMQAGIIRDQKQKQHL